MRVFLLTAIIVAVSSSPLTENPKWPWQVGKEYVYDVSSFTWTKFENSDSTGNAFKTQFIVRVKAPGHLLAKLLNPSYAQIQGQVQKYEVPSDLKYQPYEKFDQSFEIFVEGGRVLSLNVPFSLTVSNENLLKGLISALQVDLSSFGHVQSFPNSYDKETFQGLFKKLETDVTGNCETLYSVSPVSAEWRRELPEFVEEPFEITKSKNYDSCKKGVFYDFGVPEGAIWSGLADETEEKQFIKHTFESRILAGKQGTIYKTETFSSVFVNPLVFGQQKAEVYSYVGFNLTSIQPESSTEWQKSDEIRKIDSLLYTLTESTFITVDAENVAKSQKVLQEITPLLQDPNNLPKADFLSKFSLLVRNIYSMTPEQLTLMTSSIDIAKSSKDAAKYNMWVIYRDAVAQSGSIAAFKEIKNWILTKKVRGEEAAEIISSLAVSLCYSTKEIMSEFFDLALAPEVREQSYLNTSALLAVTKFIRFNEKELFVVDKVIPRLSQELTQAIEKGENSTALIYVRVLGNLAYPEILKVFAPYLEGRIPVTNYLRTQMVTSLKTLANMKNENVRAVLFSILRNTAETYEVRVAAALNIFLAYPTPEMMQIMAHMTNMDPSAQVRAVLSTGIRFAANLKDPRFAELSRNAQAVLSVITDIRYGYQYSTDSLIDTYSSNDVIAHFRELSFIGSENSALPKYHRSALRLRGTGLTEENWATFSVSDVPQLVDFYMEKFCQPVNATVDFKFSAKKIFEMLNIKRKPDSPLEGSFFFDILNQQNLYAFTENEFFAYFLRVSKSLNDLSTGHDFNGHFTKVLIHKPVFVTFPLAMGMPFVFKYSEPILISAQAQVSAKLGEDKVTTLSTDIKFTYARNMDGSVGFLDTLSEVYASTGIVNKLQFYIPAKFSGRMTNNDIKINFEMPEQDTNIMHMSVWPYTALQKLNSLVVVSEDPATKLIERPAKVASTNLNLGQGTGVGLLFKGYSYSTDYEKMYDIMSLYRDEILTYVAQLLYQKDVALTQFDLKYLAKETKNKAAKYTFFYDSLYNQKESGELGSAMAPSDITPNSVARRKEMAKRVASGIESAKVNLFDFSAVYDGEKKVEQVLTAALASSPVDNKAQAALFIRGCEQMNAIFKVIKPKIAPLNFNEALKNEIKALYEADIRFENNVYFKLNAVGERSKDYTEKLLNDPEGKKCLQETSKDNYYQQDCYKMIIKAHAPDVFKGTVTYGDITPSFLNMTYYFYQVLKDRYKWDEEQDFTKKIVEDGKIEMKSQAFYYENYVDHEFTTKYGEFRFKNIEGLPHYPYAMAFYYPLTNWERSDNCYSGFQSMPFCSVDNSKVWTFSGRSYNYSLTGSWHVVMVDEAKTFGNDLVILARRPSENQEEVYISYKTDSGKYIEADIKPTSVEVRSNADKVSKGLLTTYANGESNVPFFEYFTLAEGVQFFSINDGAIRMIYDTQRLVIFSDKHRSTTSGICGQSTTEERDDFMTPYGLVDLAELYGASFSLDGEFSDPKTVELRKEAKLKAYQPVTKYTNIFRSDAEWSRAENESIKSL